MDIETFVKELEASNNELLDQLRAMDARKAFGEGNLDVRDLLKIALKNEIEAAEIAARWIGTTPQAEVKLAFARQVGDEAKHYRLIEQRLKELGVDLTGFDPLAQGYSLLFQYLTTLTDTVERVAAGQFTRESIALIKNQQFIDFCESIGDQATAGLYRDIIQPDERFHHELGRRLLLKYALTPEQQEQARRAAARTLELAEELQDLAWTRARIHHAPGC
ncbi:MAG TPA: ferritin-like domain-containing protein [Candidatus Limnocylindrales bacterium]|nr:ferritin-like domain-containing protein [Candidatus Limnocylindrales bacterium]